MCPILAIDKIDSPEVLDNLVQPVFANHQIPARRIPGFVKLP